jgi:hypothetical protein
LQPEELLGRGSAAVHQLLANAGRGDRPALERVYAIGLAPLEYRCEMSRGFSADGVKAG